MTYWAFNEANRPGREALSDAMMAYVARFARTGNPNATCSVLPEWEPWSNEVDAPKCILFDVDGDALDITMSTVEVTIPGVLEAMESEVEEPLYSEAYDYLTTMSLVSYLFE
jgi:para-nitrobenzyl esterase